MNQTVRHYDSVSSENRALLTVRLSLLALYGVSAAIQLLILSGTTQELASVALVSLGAIGGGIYCLNGRVISTHPVSTILVLSFSFCSMGGALLVKTLEGASVAEGLNQPCETFLMLALAMGVMIASHFFYCRSILLSNARAYLSDRVLHPLGTFRWPTDRELWVVGLIGLASVLYIGGERPGGPEFGTGVLGEKLLAPFRMLKFAPFLIPFAGLFSGDSLRAEKKTPLLTLSAYFVCLVLSSFATNSRSDFAEVIPTLAVLMLIAIALGHWSRLRIRSSHLLATAVAGVVALAVLSRLALAMVAVREFRTKVSADELIRITFDAFFNSSWLDSARARIEASAASSGYSEFYVENPFLSRLIVTKFHDNVFYYSAMLRDIDINSLRQVLVDKLVLVLPEPVALALGFSLNKLDYFWSSGDFVFALAQGHGLGGFRMGSMIAELYAGFGWMFAPLLTSVVIVVFLVHDAFVTRSIKAQVLVSPIILLLIWTAAGTTGAYGFNGESAVNTLGAILRVIPQFVLTFLVAGLAAKSLVRFMSGFLGSERPPLN